MKAVRLKWKLIDVYKRQTYTDGREETELYRDMWFFSYLCNGINFRDMLYLTYGNIVGGEICFEMCIRDSGNVLRLGDVADIELGRLAYTFNNMVNGHKAVSCLLYTSGFYGSF